MAENTAVAALQRALSEHREAKRKIQMRLAEIESESASLRSQITSLDSLIDQTEMALLRMLFPDDKQISQTSRLHPTFDFRPAGHQETEDSDFEAAIAKVRENESAGNVRFADFRIPQAATIVLREASRPLHVSEIYRRLAEGGFEFRGQHQLITLAVSLSRSKRFRKVAPGTFELDPEYSAGQVA
ncbi:MAG: hypothetical protein AB7H86_04260 [Blastocatellales bacterium]